MKKSDYCLVYDRVDLSDNDRTILKRVWSDPDVRRILNHVREQMHEKLFQSFMQCAPERIDFVRNQVQAIDIVFGVITQSTKSEDEVKEEVKDAKRTVAQVGAPV